MRKVPLQIRLIAFTENDDGSISVLDIVETSFHFASHFTRRWMRDPQICRIRAERYDQYGARPANLSDTGGAL